MIKVILLLSVILIFSYVNTKKEHVDKINEIKKKSNKKSNRKSNRKSNTNSNKKSNTNSRIGNIVEKTQLLLKKHSKSITGNVGSTEENITEGFGNIKEGLGNNEENDRKVDKFSGNVASRASSIKNQKCKYRGITLFRWVYWFFKTILFIFVWLANAIWDLIDDKTKQKPVTFITTIFSPVMFGIYGLQKIFNGIIWILGKLKYAVVFIITTIGNILFVFFPDFVIEILSYFFSPLIVLWRSIANMTIFSPFGAFCWD
tara:strand:- start:861 stop:1637 length:777 start_codon:yes stop_codon:yes gene_type:complete